MPPVGLIGQRLQGDQRSHHLIAIAALIIASAGPVGPEALGVLQRLQRIDRRGHRQMRGAVAEHERHGLPGLDLELGDRRHILAAGLDRRAQHRHVRPADRQQRRAVLGPLHPGNARAEAEADHELHAHLDASADAAHEANEIGGIAAGGRAAHGHEIDQRRRRPRRFQIASRGSAYCPGSGARCSQAGLQAPSAIARSRWSRAVRRNRLRNRRPASTASRSIRSRPTSAAVSQSPITP